MKIVEQSHEILSLPNNLLEIIEKAGRTCYKSEKNMNFCTLNKNDNCKIHPGLVVKICDASKCPYHSSYKFVQMLRDRGHHAMIEFGDITVKFITNRGVTHELVRHRLCSFAQESTRYVRYDGQMEFIRPVWCPKNVVGDYPEWNNAQTYTYMHRKQKDNRKIMCWLDSCITDELKYNYLIENGWRPEQAREVLPNSLKTEIVVKGNIREWRHCLQLRTSKKAHPQIQALMLPLLAELKTKIPVVFDDLED